MYSPRFFEWWSKKTAQAPLEEARELYCWHRALSAEERRWLYSSSDPEAVWRKITNPLLV